MTFSGTWYAVHTYLLCGNSGTGTCQANMEVEPKVIVTDDESDCCACEDSSKEDGEVHNCIKTATTMALQQR